MPDAEILLVKRSDGSQPLKKIYEKGIEILSSLDQSRISNSDVLVIASPSSLHYNDVAETISLTRSVLIEKPLTANVATALALQGVLNKSGKRAGVGYHLRFTETVIALKKILTDIDSGPIISTNFQYSQKLSLWRDEIDPNKSVTARSDLGGGVLLELSHEIDALQLLVGQIVSVHTTEMRFDGAPTDGTVETLATFSGICSTNVEFVIHLDMLADPPIRNWEFVYEKLTVKADLLAGEIFLLLGKNEVLKIYASMEREREMAENKLLLSFLSSMNFLPMEFCTVSEALNVMYVIESVRNSYNSGCLESVITKQNSNGVI